VFLSLGRVPTSKIAETRQPLRDLRRLDTTAARVCSFMTRRLSKDIAVILDTSGIRGIRRGRPREERAHGTSCLAGASERLMLPEAMRAYSFLLPSSRHQDRSRKALSPRAPAFQAGVTTRPLIRDPER